MTITNLLVDKHLAVDDEHAARMLEDLEAAGYQIRPAEPLDPEQTARSEALRRARDLLTARAPLSTPALTPAQVSELVPLARFILTGSEFEPRAVRNPTPDEAVAFVQHVDQGDVADILRTPEGLRTAMQAAAAARA